MASKAPKPRLPEDDEEAYPYVLTNVIGTGSFATVYRGYHVKNRSAVAIKTVSKAILTAKLLDNLESEITILKSLNHRNITALKDIVKAEKHIYLIMDYCSGGDLSNYIKARGKVDTLQYVPEPGAAPIFYPHPKSGGLDRKIVRSFLRQLAEALKFLRERNLIHRDLKPQNLLLQPAADEDLASGLPLGTPILKVADFGFARILPHATLAETLCGSPLYMAPEILSYEKYDAKADLWSVGAVLYEMSVGRPPFRANNHIELLNKINRADSRVSFPDEDPSKVGVIPVPPDIKQLIRILLRRHPVERAGFDDFFNSPVLNGVIPGDGRSVSVAPAGDTKRINEQPIESTPVKIAIQGNGEAAVAVEGSPYDPKLYQMQNEFHFTRKKHRDKDRSRDRHRDREKAGENTAPVTEETPQSGVGERQRDPSSLSRRSGAAVRARTDVSTLLTSVDVEGVLRQDYVLVDDTRAVEFNRVADEIEAARKKSVRKPSGPSSSPRLDGARRTLDAAPTFRHVSEGSSSDNNSDRDPHKDPHRSHGTPPSSDVERNPPTTVPTSSLPNHPPFAATYRKPTDLTERNDYKFPPTPRMSSGTTLATPLLIKPPASALARALNIASKKLFGSPTAMTDGTPSSPGSITRRESEPPSTPSAGDSSSPRFLGVDLGIRAISPAENELLGQLEGIARKAHVLSEWADTKFEKVEASPSKPLSDPSQFVPKRGEAPHRADSRRKREIEMEQHAMHCISLYLTVMAFGQKAIDLIRVHSQRDENRSPSSGVDEAFSWARDTFNRSMDKVNTLKTWLPEGYSQKTLWIDRVIYDHALNLLRHAATLEPIFDRHKECEEEYERALWMLYAIEDDVVQAENPYVEQDKKTISNFISNTKQRLTKLRQRVDKL
ncbi:kinase-like domain-containing protein [Cantharellus anzutake]|uniref:kinase-like domain-containing protein n=1 Tax=Cantharellus anzutake TaxID=1750568 RepID=UPI001902C87B|nr:kinase-like domain-containing protein [Cantharellus anzutake]KAF8337034.1 kinase-like domain-containing protein [Cantharellus anzutake]